MDTVHIAVDLMGGDHGPSIILPAVQRFLVENPASSLALCGTEQALDAARQNLQAFVNRLEFISCCEEVAMNEKPSVILRQKKESSLYKVVHLVAEHKARACVSAGNTGAFMAAGHYLIPPFPGIERPAACAQIPTESGWCLMLDLGANVDCSAEQLTQFAWMGSVYARALWNLPRPRVALLSTGEELGKGNQQVKHAAELLAQEKKINYVGLVEGDGVFSGAVDVVVCDGFTGNAVLKASEGVARLIEQKIKAILPEDMCLKLAKAINPSHYNGATLLGLQGVLVVSHGNVNVDGFLSALDLAANQVHNDLPAKISHQLTEVFNG